MKKLLAILLLTFAVSCSPSVKTVNYGTAGQTESMCKLDKGNGAVLTTDCLWKYSFIGNKSGYPLLYHTRKVSTLMNWSWPSETLGLPPPIVITNW